MRTVLTILIILILNSGLLSQNFWAYTAAGFNQDEALDICYDPTGNIISTGYFSGQTFFNYISGISLTPASSGTSDIYISKSSPTGQVLWAKKAGGFGSDKSLSVKADGSGNIYITGFYYGSATFGSLTLNSVNGSQDGFIAKLDANGNFLWATSFGGNLSEQGNAITVDGQGYPVITGQFRGTASFGNSSMTSLLNPVTGYSSSDIFVARYAPTGQLDWVRQGKAKYDDKGLDIITDPANNIYVCGQFSDTITFTNTYNNSIANASFLVKYNSTGQEQWLRKMAGVYSIAYSMAIDNTNKIYLCGDFQGTLTYFGPTGNSFVNGLYSNKAFLLKVDNNGAFIWGKSESSTGYVSGKRVALDAQQDPYVFGEFGCTMKEYSDAYGPGVFNSIGFKDFFITKYSSGGTRQWFRHFGGPGNDNAHGLLIAGIDEPVMTGSFEKRLNIPVTLTNFTTVNTSFSGASYVPDQPPTYCSAPSNYRDYADIACNGYSDIFLFKGMDLTRNPYDYYKRSGTGCSLGIVPGCIDGSPVIPPPGMPGGLPPTCRDTLISCGDALINSLTNTHAFTGGSYSGIGPEYTYIWNSNQGQTGGGILVQNSGVNTVSITTLDGCYSSTASIYVLIHPFPPPPVISDSYGVNMLQPPNTNAISLCGTHTITLTGGNVKNTYGWSGPYISTHDSIAVINISGLYSFTTTDQHNCSSYNSVIVDFVNPIPGFTPKQKNDTLTFCQGGSGRHMICDSTTNPTLNYPYTCVPFSYTYIQSSSPGLTISSNPPCDLSTELTANASGNYTYTIAYVIHTLCNDDTIFFTGHIYIDVKPSPSGAISVIGGGFFCPGDSIMLTQGNISIFSPNTSYTVSPSGPIWLYHSGLGGYGMLMVDTITGCSNFTTASAIVTEKPQPFITPNPYNSLICPNDSVKLSVNLTGVSMYEWHGPGGIIPLNNRVIYTRASGFYYCVVTDSTGCVFTTSPVELIQYTTPYLAASPSGIVCNHRPISLHVIALDSTMILWASPIFGSGATKLISNPGVYSCSVTMCGITTALSFTVTGSNPTANITVVGSNTICPFDSVSLHGGPTGMVSYNWQPVDWFFPTYVTHDPGDYTLEIMDSYGCTATASVNVAFNGAVTPPTLPDNDTICAGQAATLSVTSTGNAIDWFYNNSSGPVIHSGNPYVTPPLNSQTTYYAASVNTSGCHSTGVPVTAFIYNTSLTPVLVADTSVCSGDSLKITGPAINGATYTWSGPGVNNITTSMLSIPNAGTANGGIYALSVSGFGCTSATASVAILVVDISAPNLPGKDSICSNTFYSMSVNPTDPNGIYTWEGPNGFTMNNDSLVFPSVQLNNSGTYFVTLSQLGCVSDTSFAILTVLETPATPVITSNAPVCVGDSIRLNLSPSSTYPVTWLGPNGFNSHQNHVSVYAPTTALSGVYSVSQRNLFCQGAIATQSIQVLEYPQLSLSNDTAACNDSPINLHSHSNYPYYVWNTGANTAIISVEESGIYIVSVANGRCAVSDTVVVNMAPCNITVPNVFTPNGDGSNELFFLRSAGIKEVYCEIWDRWGLKMAEFNGPENGWNGWNIYTNEPCSEGTYFYVAYITTMNGMLQTVKGFVTLMR